MVNFCKAWSQLIIMHRTGHMVFERKGRFKFHLYEPPGIFTELANGNVPRACGEKLKFCKHHLASNVIVGTQSTNNKTESLKSVRALCGSVQGCACALRDGKVLGWNEMGDADEKRRISWTNTPSVLSNSLSSALCGPLAATIDSSPPSCRRQPNFPLFQ